MSRIDTAPRRGRPKKKRGASPLTVVGVLLLAIGLGCLGYIGWQYFGTNVVSQRAFNEERGNLREQWQGENNTETADPGSAVPGDAVALMRIPALGEDYEVPVLKGTDAGTLARGLGWYENTAQPGEVGNFAVAGHRVTHGEPFARILELEKGDEVVVETSSAVYTYEITVPPKDITVDDSETWPLDPVPDHESQEPNSDQDPSEAILTLTTCTDLFHSPDRSIGFAVLSDTENK
ncbi:class E sortase [Naumannella halotolerans]|uniref:class E sortase n=1 Tax=Naumannella halotolerans TaxID=993414 RepID=UPI00370D2E65